MDKIWQCISPSSRLQPCSGKKKVVLKVQMEDTKMRAKVMKSVVRWHGVTSASLEGKENNEIALVGEGIDPVKVIQKLRKEMGFVEVVKIEDAKEEKKEEKEKEKPIVWMAPPQPYYAIDPYYNSPCSIL
ncbi:hypothetical protein J5N97_026421 [Dioscorea zingiberensis]|uniref:Uncharacterized protein n=1 Tax=Dioscorea zingiberensis TaxID=325984 RepID=A0A9D5H6P3_9LILI|nr:hypothetical protein J5N97_026421 [Dioscorea zingiberensis]